jgi:hypothetical protein
MAKRALNDRTIKALKPARPGQRRDLWDTVVPGLGIRSTDKGNHTYVLLSRFPGSRNPTRRAIAEVGALGLAEARTKARHWLALIAKGIDPHIEVERERLAEQRKQADTFAAVAETLLPQAEDPAPRFRRRAHCAASCCRRVIAGDGWHHPS